MLAFQQHGSLDKLARDLRRTCCAVQPFFYTLSNSMDELCVNACSVAFTHAVRLMKDHGTFATEMLEKLDDSSQQK
jgi:hypothetical protein